MEGSRRLIGQCHGINAVDERLQHLPRISLEFGEQRLQPSDVHFGVRVEEEQHRRVGGPRAVHPRHHQSLPRLVTQESHFRQEADVVAERQFQIYISTAVVNQYHLRNKSNQATRAGKTTVSVLHTLHYVGIVQQLIDFDVQCKIMVHVILTTGLLCIDRFSWCDRCMPLANRLVQILIRFFTASRANL